MKMKLFVVAITLSLLFSGVLIGVGSEATEESKGEYVEEIKASSSQEIHDWHDLDAVRDDLGGHYVLMNDLDEDTDGYDEIASGEANPLNDRDEWTFGLEYEIGDLVYIDTGDLSQNYFYCIRAHTSDSDNEPIEGGDWEEYWVETDKQGGDELGFRPIGILDDNEFYGEFDGNGYKIEDVVIKREDEDLGGLFRASIGEIHDLHLMDFEIDINSRAGSLVGYLTGDGLVEKCSAENIEIEGYRGSLEEELRTFIGGLIGRASGESEVTNSHVKNIDATAPGELGGLA